MVIGELLEFFPLLAFGEDWMQGPEVVSGQGLHHGKSNGSTSVNSLASDLLDAVGDVLQVSSNGVAPSIHRFCCGGSCGVESLNLRLQG